MSRQLFEQKQRRLRDEVLVLGGHVEDALRNAVNVFQQHDDIQFAVNLIANNRNINRKCAAIETETLALLATQQPMAGDMRTLASILEVALELDHIADHTKEIAGVKIKLGRERLLDTFSDINYMVQLAATMLRQSLDAFARLDANLARTIPCQDDEIDRLYAQLHQRLLNTIRLDQKNIGQAIYLSLVGHHLERVADRSTNICEWVVFAVTGEMKELNVNTYDF